MKIRNRSGGFNDPALLSRRGGGGQGGFLRPRARGSGDTGHLPCQKKIAHPPILPQIKISVIKLLKVVHASMPLGSRPDFRRHTVVGGPHNFYL